MFVGGKHYELDDSPSVNLSSKHCQYIKCNRALTQFTKVFPSKVLPRQHFPLLWCLVQKLSTNGCCFFKLV